MEFLAQGSEGGGAALNEIIGLSVVGGVVAAILLWIGYMHRNRKITWLNSFADWTGRQFKRPSVGRAADGDCSSPSIICALFGFIWDVSLHIGNGRDDGALANPAHYFILYRTVRHLRRRLHRDACCPYEKMPGPALRRSASPTTGTHRSAES